jgi:hypothetical protein
MFGLWRALETESEHLEQEVVGGIVAPTAFRVMTLGAVTSGSST